MASNVTHLKEEGAQSSLKARMAALMEDCVKYRELAAKSSAELEQAKAKRSQTEIQLALTNKKLDQLETDYEQQTAKLNLTVGKLEETAHAADECDRQRRQLDNRRVVDEEKLVELEQLVRETSEAAMDAERRYDDVSRKLLMTEAELERVEGRAEAAELKVSNLNEDMRSLASKLKAMQTRVDKASKREELFDKTIEDLRAQLARAEQHGSEADRSIATLQRDIDRMQDEVMQTKLQYASLREELDPYSREIRAN